MEKDKNVNLTSSQSTAFVFMIIGCVCTTAFTYGVGLLWCIPMTIIYFKTLKKGLDVSNTFKVCTLLFVNMIAGIIMLTSAKVENIKEKTNQSDSEQTIGKQEEVYDPLNENDKKYL